MDNKLALFEEKQIRKTWQEDKWYFSVIDVIYALTDSNKPRDYWYRLKQMASEEEQIELSTICRQLKLESTDGKKYSTDCADTEGILRIIQSIPSPKAESFKRWLAKVGRDYAILTNEIYKSGFGINAKEYKEIKGIHESQNLRDSMTNIELALTNLGEAAAVEFHQSNNSHGMKELKDDVNKAGNVLNKAKQEIEKELKRPVVTSTNYIDLTENKKLIGTK